MLVLRRKEGQWIDITHRSGDVLRVRVYDLRSRTGQVSLAFDDADRNFAIQRPEAAIPDPDPEPVPSVACCPDPEGSNG